MSVTGSDGWTELLQLVDDATVQLRAAATVPSELGSLVDSFDARLADLTSDRFVLAKLFEAAYRAEKALRDENPETRRRELRFALEQFRQRLRDTISDRPTAPDVPVREVLARSVAVISVSQDRLAELLGVSKRQLQRWLSEGGPGPTGRDEARIRIVGQAADQLRHAFTGPGVVEWFLTHDPQLGVRPIEWLDEPLRYPQLLAAATATRSMVA